MRRNVLHGSAEPAFLERPRAFDTILYGGLVLEYSTCYSPSLFTADTGCATAANFQSVAAGLLVDQPLMKVELKLLSFGILLHFVVATCIATVYFLASRVLPMMIRHPIASGLTLRDDRLSRHELSRSSSLSDQKKSWTESSYLSFSTEIIRTRFPGWIAARTVGAADPQKE
jgi:hypothetical protein